MSSETKTWDELATKMLVVSRLTHTRGISSCFGHMSDDVADQRYYPTGPAGLVMYAEGLQRVFDRYVGSRYDLTPAHLPMRDMKPGYYIVTADGDVAAGPFRTHRGAAWVCTHRQIDGHACRITEDRGPYMARCMDAVDEQLALESAWRDASDALHSYCGIDIQSDRWFDSGHQLTRRECAERTIADRIENS